MKNKLITGIKTIAIIVAIMLSTNKINAQPNPGPGNQGGGIGPTNDGVQVPFDGGMSLMLIASGIGYGAKKLKRHTLKQD